MRTALTLCALLALVATGACSSGKKVSVGDTTVTTNDDNTSTTVKTSEGSMSVGGNAVDPNKLGAPVYPGATQAEGAGGISFSTADQTSDTASFTSADPFETVYDFYRSKMPAGSEKLKMASGDTQLASFQVGEQGSKEVVSVMLSAKDGKTQITISHVTKSDAAMASAAPSTAPSPGESSSDGGGS